MVTINKLNYMTSPDYLPDWADNVPVETDVTSPESSVVEKTEQAPEQIDVTGEIAKFEQALTIVKEFLDPEHVNKLDPSRLTSEQCWRLYRCYDGLFIRHKQIEILHGHFASINPAKKIDVKEFRKRVKDRI